MVEEMFDIEKLREIKNKAWNLEKVVKNPRWKRVLTKLGDATDELQMLNEGCKET